MRLPSRRVIFTSALVCALASEAPRQAVAQEPPPRETPRGVEEIVVTAQRREENLQQVPIAITAYTADTIESRDIKSVADLEFSTPSFVYAHVVGTAQPTIRGVGSDLYTVSGEPGVALYLDDIYLGRTFLPQVALTQIERIEVLRGPQGSLYGRNTSGGAIKFVSKRPTDELDASASVQYGSFDQFVGKGSVAGPVVRDVLKGRLSLFGEAHDGWTENLATGEDLDDHQVFSGRVAVEYDPLPWLTIGATGDGTQQRDGNPVLHALTPVIGTIPSDSAALPILFPYDAIIADLENRFGVVLDPLRQRLLTEVLNGRHSDDPRKVYLDGAIGTELESTGAAVDVTAEFDLAEVKLIGGYRDSDRFQRFDADGSDIGIAEFDPTQTSGRQWSGELHVTSDGAVPFGLGRFRSLAGFFYYDEKAAEDIEVELGLFGTEGLAAIGELIPPEVFPIFQDDGISQLHFRARQKTRSWAPFGEIDWDPLDWLTLRLGGRYTKDTKSALISITTAIPGEACQNLRFESSYDSFTGRAGADVKLGDSHLLYGSFSQGFKSGGFNNTGCADPYDPEHVDAWEAGLKTEWLDRRLRLNLVGFYYTFDDIQVQRIEGLRAFIINAGKAEVKGAEIEASAIPYEGLLIDANLAWLDAKYHEFFDDDPITQFEGPIDLSGNRLPKSPEWSTSIGVEYAHSIAERIEASARVSWSYRDRLFFSHFNDPSNGQKAHQLWDAYVKLETPSRRFGFQGFVKNIANDDYRIGGVIASIIIGGPLGHYAPPRTWGAEVFARF